MRRLLAELLGQGPRRNCSNEALGRHRHSMPDRTKWSETPYVRCRFHPHFRNNAHAPTNSSCHLFDTSPFSKALCLRITRHQLE